MILPTIDFYKLNKEKAWLLGFIFSDSTIGEQMGQTVIRLYNKDKELLENIKIYFQIPYKVCTQRNQKNILYYIRFSNPTFVSSVESYGFKKDRTELSIPKMNDANTKQFIKGFLTGKSSYFKEEYTEQYGIKIIYRSQNFIEELAKKLSTYCKVNTAKPYCRFVKNLVSCQIKYVNNECDKINAFVQDSFDLSSKEINYTIQFDDYQQNS